MLLSVSKLRRCRPSITLAQVALFFNAGKNLQNDRMKNWTATSTMTGLIVNADDFAYYDCVSQGILRLARAGIVTATGIMANSSHFHSHAVWLQDCENLDVGVHLNLTAGEALSLPMRKEMGRQGGRLPGKYGVCRGSQ
jgi:hypothetical protein